MHRSHRTNALRIFAFVACAACSSPAKPAHEAVRVPATVAEVTPIVAPPAQPAQNLVMASCANALSETDASHPLVPATMLRRGGSVMSPQFTGGEGFYRVNGVVTAPRTTSDLPFELQLVAPATASTSAPVALSLTFANTSQKPVIVLRPLDGSMEHMRDPVVDLYLRDETTGDVYAWAFHGGRCGNMNLITAADFITIAPSQTSSDVHRNGWAQHLEQVAIGRAGTYSLWVVYEMCGRGLGMHGPNVPHAVSAGAHASNAVRVVVR